MARNMQRRGVASWVGLGVAGLLVITTAVVWGSSAASAHHSGVALSAKCADGRSAIAVTLRIYNSQGGSQPLTLNDVVSSGFVTPDGATSGSTIAGGSGGRWTEFTFDLPVTATGKISYAFNVRWSNGTTARGYKAEATLPVGCQPPPPEEGAFSVTKQVTGERAGQVPGTTFTVDYACTNQAAGTLTLVDGGTSTVSNLPVGTQCTLAEGPLPATAGESYAYDVPTFVPAGPVTIVKDQTIAVALTNPIIRVTGGFSVTKALSGATDGYVSGSTFPVSYTCSNNTSGSFDLAAGATETVTGLPVGTTCTLSEGARPDTVGPVYSYGTEVFSPSDQVTVSSSAIVAVVLTNPLDKHAGGFSVTKALSGATDGYVPGSTFVVDYSCTDGTAGSLTLTANETKAVSDVLAGSRCTLTEGAPPATADVSYVYGTPTFAPTSVVDVTSGDTVQVTLTNPIERVLGSLTVTKTISGATAGYVAGSTFGFTVDCAGTANDTTVSLVAGETKAVTDIPLGVSCTVTETTVPAPIAGYRYDPPTVSPAGGTVVIDSASTPVSLTFDNPLVWLPKPVAEIAGDCDTQSAIVSLANVGGGTVTFVVVVDGTPFGPDRVVSTTEQVLVPLTEDVPVDVEVYAGPQQLVTSSVVTNDCQQPRVPSITSDCVAGGTVVTLANAGVLPVDLTVLKDGAEIDTVTVGSTEVVVVVPMVEDETATIEVHDGSKTIATKQVTLNCQGPKVESMAIVCAAGGVAVVLTNEGVNPVDLTVYKGGAAVQTVTVGSTDVTVLVPMAEDETATIEVRDGSKTIDSSTFTLDCENPQVKAIAADCAEGGVVVRLTNDGQSPVDLVVTKDGVKVADVTVGSTEVVVLVPMVEGETATIEVKDGPTVLATQQLTLDCENPQVISIVVDCAVGGAVVALSNDGANPVELTVRKDGEVVETVTVGTAPVTVLVPMAEDETATIEVQDGPTVLASQQLTLDCQNPGVTAIAKDCAEGGASVVLTNDGANPVELTVRKDGEVVETVTVGTAPVTVLVPMAEDETATIEVQDGPTVLASQPVTFDCEMPSVKSVATTCADGGLRVTLANDGESPVGLTVLKDGVEVATVVVGSTPVDVLVPFGEDETAVVEVKDGSTLLSTQEVTFDCEMPRVDTISAECAEGGVVVTLSNDGESPVELTVSKDGVDVDTVSVGQDPVEVVVPFDEDETATIEVRDGDVVLQSQELTLDCEEPPPTTTTEPPTTTTEPPSDVTDPPATDGPTSTTIPTSVLGKVQTPGTLPVTGATIVGIVTVGLALLLGGAAIVGVTRRRRSS